jgi:uncharacterized protein (TIGR02246 family)
MAFLYVLALFLACNSCTLPPDNPNAQAQQEIQQRWLAFAADWAKLDAAACAAYYTPDAIHIAPELSENEGIKAIENFYAMLFGAHQQSRYQHKVKRMDVKGDMAVELGNFEVQWVRKDSSEWVFKARAIIHWTKADGQWKIKTLMFESEPDIDF